jgi:hypothetical protein
MTLRVFQPGPVVGTDGALAEDLLMEGSLAAITPSARVEEVEEAMKAVLDKVNMAMEGYLHYFL